MKLLSILFIFAGVLSLTACDDAKKQLSKAKIENPLAGHMEALKAAKDVERQLLESEEKRRKMIDALAVPGS